MHFKNGISEYVLSTGSVCSMKLLVLVGEPFLKMGITYDNFQFKGKDESLRLLLEIVERLWIAESPTRDKCLQDRL